MKLKVWHLMTATFVVGVAVGIFVYALTGWLSDGEQSEKRTWVDNVSYIDPDTDALSFDTALEYSNGHRSTAVPGLNDLAWDLLAEQNPDIQCIHYIFYLAEGNQQRIRVCRN